MREALTLFPACVLVAVSAQAPPSVNYPLYVFWSATHNDNAVFGTAASIASLDSTYSYYATDAYTLSNTTKPSASTVPLWSWFNSQTNHHLTTASATGNAWAAANGYVQLRVEGFVYPNNSDGTMIALEMWYSADRGDHFLVGSAVNRANVIGAGYTLLYVDSYVPCNWVVWPSAPPPGSPFAQSPDLLDYELAWDMAATPPGIGADTWYPAWTDIPDPTSTTGGTLMLSSWTDGTVNGVGSSSADSGGRNATTGIAIVLGDDPWNLTIVHASTYTEAAYPYQGRYPSISTYKDGVWYYGAYALENYNGNGQNPGPDCGNWCVLGPVGDIRYSMDAGASWTAPRASMTSWTDNLWHEEAVNNSKVVMGAPHAIDFGQNMQHSPDGRMYLVATGAIGPQSYQSWMQGDSVHLARTVASPDPTQINNAQFWEFWTGGHGSSATWSAPGDVTAAAPLFTWPNRTGVVTCSYNPTLAKYLMVVSTPTNSPYTIYHFDTYLLESDDMTGPYSLVSYMSSFGPQAYFVHWPSKFMGTAGGGALAQGSEARRKSRLGGVPTVQERQRDSLARLTDPLTQEELHARANATYYSSYLSYSGNFASGYEPVPPGTGYHWTLQLSRMRMGPALAERVRQRLHRQ